MKLTLINQRLFRRLKIYQSFKKVYRGSLSLTTSWKTEAGLTVLLYGGMGLMMIVACLQMKAMFFDTDKHMSGGLSKNIQLPLLTRNLPVEQVLSHINLEVKNADTLFQLNKQDVFEALSDQPTQTKKPNRAVKVTVSSKQLWQLQIHRPPVSQALMVDAITNAHKQLQSGHANLAMQAFLVVLTKDTHSVEAMEGMLLVSRQLGDSQSEMEYLERLRQEIPDYDSGNVLGNDASSSADQS